MNVMHPLTGMDELAQKMLVAAAVASPQAAIGFAVTPDLARKLAQVIDGGGYHARIAETLAEERRKRMLWVNECQEHLAKANRANRGALIKMIISLVGVVIMLVLGAGW